MMLLLVSFVFFCIHHVLAMQLTFLCSYTVCIDARSVGMYILMCVH
jgi:hypothetical protein